MHNANYNITFRLFEYKLDQICNKSCSSDVGYEMKHNWDINLLGKVIQKDITNDIRITIMFHMEEAQSVMVLLVMGIKVPCHIRNRQQNRSLPLLADVDPHIPMLPMLYLNTKQPSSFVTYTAAYFRDICKTPRFDQSDQLSVQL
ncbi:hypothetical protein TNCV_2914921 [Trichonephila clavipes]|nr:hypothetical protein TNCV_2914921 [Trichonephila clavipes]